MARGVMKHDQQGGLTTGGGGHALQQGSQAAVVGIGVQTEWGVGPAECQLRFWHLGMFSCKHQGARQDLWAL